MTIQQQQQTKEPFASYAKLELMGHLSFLGFVEEVDLFGVTVIAIDPLDDEGNVGKRRYFSAGSLYSLTPCTEDEIRATIEQRRQWTERRARIMRPPQLEEAHEGDDGDSDDGDDEHGGDEGEEGAWP